MTRQHTPLSQRLAHALATPARKQRVRTCCRRYVQSSTAAHASNVHAYMRDPDSGAARALPPHKSPLAFGGVARWRARGGMRARRTTAVLPTIAEEDEDAAYVSRPVGTKAPERLAAPRGLAQIRVDQMVADEDEDEEGESEWDEQAALVALLQDE